MAYIQKRNSSYRVRYYIYENGIKKKKSKTFSRYENAKDYCVKIEHSIREQSYVEPTSMPLSEYLVLWVDEKKSTIAVNTYKGYLTNIKHINKHIGDIPL